MATDAIDETLQERLLDRIPLMVVRSTVIFPTGATALQVSFTPNVEVLAVHSRKDQVVAMVTTAEDEGDIDPARLEKVGVVVRVVNRLNLPGGTIQATLQGLIRVRLQEVRFEHGRYTAQPVLVEERLGDAAEADRCIEQILAMLDAVAAHVERVPDEAPRILRINVADPGRFADLVATLAQFPLGVRDQVLQSLDVMERLRLVHGHLQETWERVQQLERGPARAPADEDGGAGERAAPPQSRRERTAEVRQRIKALQAELGELDPAERELLDMLRRIERAQLPARVAAAARREAERLRSVPPSSTEAAEVRGYLDTLIGVPWERTSAPQPVRLAAVRRALDEHHLGLEEVKRQLLEIVSVAKLRGRVPPLVPCLVGPPGVGKRTLAAAIARGLGRPLVRIELGGRGEAELVGSRRTRSGATAGKLVSVLRDAEIRDPVYLLEELDEVGLGNVEGDPVEAMEELLDPESRHSFTDRYLNLPIDLSGTIFLATATDFMRVPRSLRDFLIEIRIAGYTPEDKAEIARRQLLPRLAADHGLDEAAVDVPEETLVFLTRGYARDAGLGNLRRALSAILRALALQKASAEAERWVVTPELVQQVLGVPRYPATTAESAPEVGVVTGLAWTASGGELMFIEALKMPGTGRLIITGLLGEVMRESVNAAYSYVRSRAAALGIPAKAFGEHDLHVHFPVGATPKDGPSAGAAVTLAIASSLAERPVRHDLAMTGEVTLRGKVLEIGGVKEKVLAAYRAGLREIIMPRGNERDLRDVPADVRDRLRFHHVASMEEVFALALLPKRKARARRAREAKAAPAAAKPVRTRRAAAPRAAD